VAEPSDLLHAWEQVIRQLRGAAAPLTDQSELTRVLLVPIQKQAELLEQLLHRQAELEKELAGRVLAPVTVALDLVEQSSAAMRAQAKALDAASASFKQAAELLELQASLLERATATVRDPVAALRSAGGAVTRGPRAPRGPRPPAAPRG
jgi:hypothetical protein